MELKFKLVISSNHGYPDSDWEEISLIDSDSLQAVETAAEILIRKQYVKYFGDADRMPAGYLDDLTVRFYRHSQYLNVEHRYKDVADEMYIQFRIDPVLQIGERFFELKETFI